MQKSIFILLCVLYGTIAQGQVFTDGRLDSLYIDEVEMHTPAKVLHAEPLYIDLIRDLGARKGEKEWNFGMGITDNLKYDTYQALIEYEFAVADRLGLEIEVPFTFTSRLHNVPREDVPSHRVESIKTAVQWTFLVSPKYNASMAIGYINELEFADINHMDVNNIFRGNVYNPFMVVAKRWGSNFHTLLYTGPKIESMFKGGTHMQYDINTNLHYMIPGTRNFVGVEVNKELRKHDFDMVIRPQIRVGITDNLLVGIVGGIPISRESQRFSTFARLIWEPGH